MLTDSMEILYISFKIQRNHEFSLGTSYNPAMRNDTSNKVTLANKAEPLLGAGVVELSGRSGMYVLHLFSKQ